MSSERKIPVAACDAEGPGLASYRFDCFGLDVWEIVAYRWSLAVQKIYDCAGGLFQYGEDLSQIAGVNVHRQKTGPPRGEHMGFEDETDHLDRGPFVDRRERDSSSHDPQEQGRFGVSNGIDYRPFTIGSESFGIDIPVYGTVVDGYVSNRRMERIQKR